MKHYFFTLFVSIFISTLLSGTPVTEQQARTVALNWFSAKKKVSKSELIIKDTQIRYTSVGTPAMYVYEFESGGFVIMSADDAVKPVLAYSTENEFSKPGEINPEIEFLLEEYSGRISNIIESKLDNSLTKKDWDNYANGNISGSAKSVPQMLSTTWDQVGIYDNYCPTGTPVGCVATAMAQIMKYHNYPETGVFQHSYVHPTYGTQVAMFKNTTYDWQNMPNTGSDAVALLSYHCGVAVDMDYHPLGSGSQTHYALYAMPNYFKYSHDIAYAYIGNYTNEEWINLLKSEMDASRPVLYSGSSTASGGHAFVLDGYDDSDLFHVNWGWGGYGNDYYAIGSLNPVGEDFNTDNAFVYNIEPAVVPEFKAVKKFSDLRTVSSAASPYIGFLQAVNGYVAWGIGRDGSGGNADYRIYTKTVDGGLNWSAKSITNMGGTAFSMIYGLSDQVAYICMYGSTQSNNKILKTVDGGETWTASKSGGSHAGSFFNVVHFFNENDGLIQGDPDTEFEIHLTDNAGETWTRVDGANIPDPLDGEFGITGLYDAVGSTIWFTTNRGRVFKSTDKGATWTVVTLLTTTNSTNIDIAFSNNALDGLVTMYEETDPVQQTGVYHKFMSSNGGETWTELDAITGNFYNNDISAVPGADGTFYSVGSDAETPMMGISYSTDGGYTWTELADYYQYNKFLSIAMASPDKGFIGSFAGDYEDGAWVLGNQEPLIAGFVADNTAACLNAEVVFTSISTGDISDYTWDFGADATPPNATGMGPHTVTYSTVGDKTVSLEVANGETTSTSDQTDYITVAEIAPGIEAITGPARVYPGTTNVYSINTQPDFTDIVWSIAPTTYKLLTNYTESVNVKAPTFNNLTGTLTVTVSNGCGTDTKTFTIKTDITVSIEDISEDEIEIFPNPAYNELNIVSDLKVNTVEFTTIAGQTVKSLNLNTNSAKISLSDMAAGVYFVKINTDTKTVTKQVIVK